MRDGDAAAADEKVRDEGLRVVGAHFGAVGGDGHAVQRLGDGARRHGRKRLDAFDAPST